MNRKKNLKQEKKHQLYNSGLKHKQSTTKHKQSTTAMDIELLDLSWALIVLMNNP